MRKRRKSLRHSRCQVLPAGEQRCQQEEGEGRECVSHGDRKASSADGRDICQVFQTYLENSGVPNDDSLPLEVLPDALALQLKAHEW